MVRNMHHPVYVIQDYKFANFDSEPKKRVVSSATLISYCPINEK